MMLARDGGCALKVAVRRGHASRTLGGGERSGSLARSVRLFLRRVARWDAITSVVNCVIFGLPRVAY